MFRKKGTLSECVPPAAAFQIPLLTESVDAALRNLVRYRLRSPTPRLLPRLT